jgi:membrane-associated phospholipid phosphatase
MPAPQNALEQADVAAGLKLARFRDHPAVQAVAKAGELSDQEPLYALSGAVLAIGVVTKDARLGSAGARMLVAALLASALKSLVKRSVTRTRPHVVMDEHRYASSPGGSEEKPEQSFPSGHAAGAAAVARALTRVYPQTGAAVLGVAALVGASRVMKGAHYPGDVLAGALVGLVAEAVVDQAARRFNA